MGLFNSFDVAEKTTRAFEIAGRTVACSHCGGQEFEESEAQLNTAGLTFLGLDWANRTATILACKECGHLEWFI